VPEVRSSHISHIEHSPHDETMVVTFRNGSRYRYHGVPASLYERFLQAPSKGGFFHKWVEKRGPLRRKFEVLE